MFGGSRIPVGNIYNKIAVVELTALLTGPKTVPEAVPVAISIGQWQEAWTLASIF